jgi:hypothetical protein
MFSAWPFQPLEFMVNALARRVDAAVVDAPADSLRRSKSKFQQPIANS